MIFKKPELKEVFGEAPNIMKMICNLGKENNEAGRHTNQLRGGRNVIKGSPSAVPSVYPAPRYWLVKVWILT